MKKTVKAYMKSKPFESIKDKFVPIPIRKGKYGVNDIIDRIQSEIPFVDKATMASVINVFNKKAVEMVSDGYNIDTGLVYLRPMITGSADEYKLDENLNKLTISAIPGKALRRAAAETKIKLTNQQDRPKGIWYVLNVVDKSETYREKCALRVGGINVKIMGDFPECGLWFYNTATKQSYQIRKEMIYYNFPKTIMFVLPPEITAGRYKLNLVTCYCGTSRLLIAPKEFNFNQTIEILPAL